MDEEEVAHKREEKYFIRPVVRVRDVAASIAYYRDKLGCTTRWQHGDDRPIIAEVERRDLAIILDSESVVPKPEGPSVITLSVDPPETLGALHREFVGRGAKIVAAPFAVIWQDDTYQFDVEDLDGNILVFWGGKP
jgi:catechol 2,3-dioxygenase-like lactoylglutathione lyase family enzyme